MGPLDLLFGQIQRAIQDHSSPNTPGPSYDPNGLLGQLSGIFGQHAQQNGGGFDPNYYNQGQQGGYGNVLSSNQDPYGDPGMQGGAQQVGYGQQGGFGNVLSSDQDPYGDPGQQGGQGGFGNVLSSDQDPYGDPGRQR
jgi:hypothetical protein